MRIRLLLLLCCTAAVAFAGTITTSVSSFPAFDPTYPFHSSTSFRYTVSASGLSGNLVITAPDGFEVSLNYLASYSRTISVTPSSGNVAATAVYARFSPSATGSTSGNIAHVSAGSATVNISVSGTCVNWAIPAGYYSTVNTQRGAALKTVLYNKISTGTTSVGYNGVWNAYATTDVQPNGKVWDIYATRFDQPSPYEYTMSTDQCGNYTVEGDCYNREHSFPKSWFNDANPMYAELFHIYASDGKVNGMRNNYPYGTVSSPTYTSQYGGKLGPNTSAGYSGTVFEPIDEYKGDLARGYLYMATRYENLIAGWIANTGATDVLAGNSFPVYKTWQLNLLLAWHELDPVSNKEIKRNNAIYALQNNRNPFVDSPQFVQRIWGSSIPAEPSAPATSLSFTHNSNTSITLNWTSGNGKRRIVLVHAGSAVNGFPTDTFHYTANSNLSSAPQLGSGNYIVYNGTGSSVTLTNLAQGTAYHVAVIEYNGWYTSANYQAAGFLTANVTTLPVNLTAFTAEKQGADVLLKWTTASEQNNARFEVQRSVDGMAFETIGTVKGAGNSTRMNRYQLTDRPEQNGGDAIYYRLKQVDLDGRYCYSEIRAVMQQQDLAPGNIVVSPNPFSQLLRISLHSGQDATVRLSLQNLNGQEYVNEEQTIGKGENTLVIDQLDDLPAGVYILQLAFGQHTRQFKLIK